LFIIEHRIIAIVNENDHQTPARTHSDVARSLPAVMPVTPVDSIEEVCDDGVGALEIILNDTVQGAWDPTAQRWDSGEQSR
jgi:hypothetical protein